MSGPSSNSPSPGASHDAAVRRLYNDALIALEILYEAATAGSLAAAEKLHSLSDQLIEAAGRYQKTTG